MKPVVKTRRTFAKWDRSMGPSKFCRRQDSKHVRQVMKRLIRLELLEAA